MTKAAYQTLYESSIAFGIRKALIAEQRKAKMEGKVINITIILHREKHTHSIMTTTFTTTTHHLLIHDVTFHQTDPSIAE